MRVVPAVLAENADTLRLELQQAARFTDYVQIDIMDGIFVPTRSFPPELISGMDTVISFEVHLMVQDPLAVLNEIRNPGLKKVIYHFEADADRALYPSIRERGLDIGLAVKPGTGLEEFREEAKLMDTLLFMTVDPGRYGSPFLPAVMQKVAAAREAWPEKTIAVDGGVSLDNLKMFYDTGVDYVCVGSRIFLEGNPERSFHHFVSRLKEIEAG